VTAEEQRSSHDVDVVIVTALAEEQVAVLAALGKDDCAAVRWAGRDVHLATVGASQVALVSLQGMGNVGAAVAAREAIGAWGPRCLVLVGIAGGVRGSAEEMRLGDVLVADQVVGFESAKVTADGLEHRYESYRPAFDLLAAANSVTPVEWTSMIGTPRPGGQGTPSVHIGTVLSGEKVFADGPSLAQLRRAWPKAVGVEMEGLGIALAAYRGGGGFLLVKGGQRLR
jgi:nucleoside phosphorylase